MTSVHPPHAAITIAEFCAGLTLRDIPADVLGLARTCIIDTVAVAAFGSAFPWSQAVARYALAYGQPGPCSLLGMSARVQAPFAALAIGAFAHAFEQDSLRKPGAGVHPGAARLAPALALAQERGAPGERVLLAFVAGCEAMFRIGAASLHSSEKLGFHAPGLTGPYGAAIAAGVVMGLDARQLGDALGIAGSLSGGLLSFSAASRGAEVKRLHLGRACESGVLAARLAAEGFAGPDTVLEGKFGFLSSFCESRDDARLTAGLGQDWETRRICIKAYACHVTAHTPIESLRALMQEHALTAQDIESIELRVSGKVLSHPDIRRPADIKQAQYSVPFCVALAVHRDPDDPAAFDAGAPRDPTILATCERIGLAAFDDDKLRSAWASRITLCTRDGRVLTREADQFRGSPEMPLGAEALRARYQRLTAGCEPAARDRWFEGLSRIESLADVNSLGPLA